VQEGVWNPGTEVCCADRRGSTENDG